MIINGYKSTTQNDNGYKSFSPLLMIMINQHPYPFAADDLHVLQLCWWVPRQAMHAIASWPSSLVCAQQWWPGTSRLFHVPVNKGWQSLVSGWCLRCLTKLNKTVVILIINHLLTFINDGQDAMINWS